MPIRKYIQGVPHTDLEAEGVFNPDYSVLTNFQKGCTEALDQGIQMKQEAYLSQHPEVKAMLEIFICKVSKSKPRKNLLSVAARHFTRPTEVLDREIREHLKLPPTGPYLADKKAYTFTDDQLAELVENAKRLNRVVEPPKPESVQSTVESTISSPFSSIVTTDTTQPTPERIPTPEPTLSEQMFDMVSQTVDKAIFLHVDECELRYDTAYVEVSKAVEEAMEVPVIELREDLAEMLQFSWKMFECDIIEKERIAHELELASRMSKATKKTLREMANFRGYAPPTPPADSEAGSAAAPGSPLAEISIKEPSEHERIARPVYNRYDKDRFGVYRNVNAGFNTENVTVTPPLSENTSTTAVATVKKG